MASLDRRIRILRRMPPRLAASAMIASLPHVSAQERRRLLDLLLSLAVRRPRLGLMRDILRHWRHLDDHSSAALVAVIAGDLPDLLRVLMRSDDPGDHESSRNLAVEAARLACSSAPPPDIAAVRATLLRALRAPPTDTCLTAAATRLDRHRTPEALEGLVLMAGRAGPRLRAWLGHEGEVGHMSLRSTARFMSPADRRHWAVDWLGVPALRAVGRDSIDRDIRDRGAAEAHVGRAHLLRVEERRLALRLLPSPSGLIKALFETTDLAVESRRARLQWIVSVERRPHWRAEALSRAWSDPSQLVRLDAVRALDREHPSRQGDESLRDFAFDPSEPVARAAVASIVDSRTFARRAHHVDLFESLGDSAHESVRQTADRALHWSGALHSSGSFIPAILAHGADPGGLVAQLRSQLEDEDADHQRALDVALRVGVLAELEPQVIRIARGGNTRNAAKATLLLGHLGGVEARRTIVDALGHEDGRVRASAVESLARQGSAADEMQEFANDRVPRVRGNAVLQMLRADDGLEDLNRMLHDPRLGHRISGLWVAHRRRVTRLTRRIARMGQSDPTSEVRLRARTCARDLQAAKRHLHGAGGRHGTIVTRPRRGIIRRAG